MNTDENQEEEFFQEPTKRVIMMKGAESAFNGGIAVKNAGMVMLNSYINLLFERLGLLLDSKFLNENMQRDAVHYLQYVATGLSHTEETFLPLNKLLSGIPFEQPVPAGIEITAEEVQLIEGLINAVIGQWPAIGETSIDGFRGNWLVRDGLLTEQDDKWELIVERKSYDILLTRAPFSFSVIKYPWMDKPLHVNWNF